MKLLATLTIAILLSACAALNPAPTVGEGAVVLSTSYDKKCKSALYNSNLQITNAESGKMANSVTVRNIIIGTDIKENGTIVHAFSLPAGKYEFNELLKPGLIITVLFRHYPYPGKPYEFNIVAGKTNYVGNVLIHEVNGSCSTSSYGISVTDMESRDLPIAKEKYPQFFTDESL